MRAMRLLGAAIALLAAAPTAQAQVCQQTLSEPTTLLERMRDDPRYTLTTVTDDYLAYMDESQMNVWTFTRPGHVPHPAIVCREMRIDDKGDAYLTMYVHCSGTTADCEALVAEFNALTEEIKRSLAAAGYGIAPD